MRETDFLIERKLLNWSSIYIGFLRGWVTRFEIMSFADSEFINSQNGSVLADLATCALEKTDLDVQDLIVARINEFNLVLPDLWAYDSIDNKQWRYAHLKSVLCSDLSHEDKILRIEEIYADFGYPEAMPECSRYYDPFPMKDRKIGDLIEGPDPIQAAQMHVQNLQAEFDA